MPFHQPPVGSSYNCPSNRPPGFMYSSSTNTDKPCSALAMEADNPAGPAPIMIVSYIVNTPILDCVSHLLSARTVHISVQWCQTGTDAAFVINGRTALETMPDITINRAGFIIFFIMSQCADIISKKGSGNLFTFIPC